MHSNTEKITEKVVVRCVKEFLTNKPDGNWHEEKIKESKSHGHGPDLILVGGKRNSEYFIIECKGKSYAASAKSVNKEGWLNPLGQQSQGWKLNVSFKQVKTEVKSIVPTNMVWGYIGLVLKLLCGESLVKLQIH